MQIAHRFFSGQQMLPRPIIHENPAEGLVIVATAWGEVGASQLVIDSLSEELNKVNENTEITRLGQFVEPLVVDNSQRVLQAIQVANKAVEKKYNSLEYSAGVELAILQKIGHQLFWYHVGRPSLFVANQSGLHPLIHSHNLAEQYHQLSPLPDSLLGTSESLHINSGQVRLAGVQKILMLSRNSIPAQLFIQHYQNLEQWSEVLAQNNVQMPFWIGTVDFQ